MVDRATGSLCSIWVCCPFRVDQWPHSIRGGTIVGEHSVLFCGRDEVIEIKHSALSREVFATGAVQAAAFLAGKTAPGLYNMSHVIAAQ